MRERWAAISGFPGYAVSDLGRVRSLERKAGNRVIPDLVLRQEIGRAGYPRVNIRRDGRGVNRDVHVLVLEAFVGPRPTGMEGCHEDGIRSNCAASNLRWDTPSANRLDAVRHGTLATTRRTHCPRDHELTEPNLVRAQAAKGRRTCLACSRGLANVQDAAKRGVELDLHVEAERHHASIMAARR